MNRAYCGRNWRRHFKSIHGYHAGLSTDRAMYPLNTTEEAIPAEDLTPPLRGELVIPQVQRRFTDKETNSRVLKWIRRKLQWLDCMATRLFDRS